MRKIWHQKAKINLIVHERHVANWTETKIANMREEIFREFLTNSDGVDLGLTLSGPQRKNIEFSAVCFDPGLDAFSIVTSMERKFFELDIEKRDVLFVKK